MIPGVAYDENRFRIALGLVRGGGCRKMLHMLVPGITVGMRRVPVAPKSSYNSILNNSIKLLLCSRFFNCWTYSVHMHMC